MNLSQKGYWLVLIAFFSVISAFIWLIAIPQNLLEYNLAVNLFTSSIFTVITIVFLSWSLDLREKAEWSKVKNHVMFKLELETSSLESNLVCYIKYTPDIQKAYNGNIGEHMVDNLAEDAQIVINELTGPFIFDNFSLISKCQQNLSVLEDKYSKFLSAQIVQSLMSIDDWVSQIESCVNVHKMSEEFNEILKAQVMERTLEERKEAEKASLKLMSTYFGEVLLETKKLRQLIKKEKHKKSKL